MISCSRGDDNGIAEEESFYGRTYRYAKSKSTHAFYIDNRLNERLFFTISETPLCVHLIANTPHDVELQTELSTEYAINFYSDITVEPNSKMLVRFYDRSVWHDAEALNAFYYPNVLYATDLKENPLNQEHLRINGYLWEFKFRDNLRNPEVWIGDYWNYEQIDRWTAEYTLVVDEAFIRKLYPSPDYDYYDFGF